MTNARSHAEQASRESLYDAPLPENQFAEKSVLSTAMADSSAWMHVHELLGADDFHLEKHRRIFTCMQEIAKVGDEITSYSVALKLKQRGWLESVSMAYLAELTAVLVPSNLVSFCTAIRHTAIRRRGIQIATALLHDLYSQETPQDALLTAERLSHTLSKAERKHNWKSRTITQVIESRGGVNAYLTRTKGEAVHIPFTDIDRVLGGLRRGRYVLLAARPSVGKSAFVHEIMLHAAKVEKRNVLLVTLEMAGDDVLDRVLTARARVNAYRFQEGTIESDERMRLMEHANELAELDETVRFLDQDAVSVAGIDNELRRLDAAGTPIDLVIIDYLQLLEPDTKDNRVQEISSISRQSKQLTQLFKIPVLAICNLSRGEKGTNDYDEPQLRWLRDSGQLEFDADQVLFMWPDKPRDGEDYEASDIRRINWSVAKNKYGRLGRGLLHFLRRRCAFEHSAEDNYFGEHAGQIPPPDWHDMPSTQEDFQGR